MNIAFAVVVAVAAVDLNILTATDLNKNINEWYFSKASIPIVEKYILELYGKDIGTIIMDYFYSIDINAPVDKMKTEKEYSHSDAVIRSV